MASPVSVAQWSPISPRGSFARVATISEVEKCCSATKSLQCTSPRHAGVVPHRDFDRLQPSSALAVPHRFKGHRCLSETACSTMQPSMVARQSFSADANAHGEGVAIGWPPTCSSRLSSMTIETVACTKPAPRTQMVVPVETLQSSIPSLEAPPMVQHTVAPAANPVRPDPQLPRQVQPTTGDESFQEREQCEVSRDERAHHIPHRYFSPRGCSSNSPARDPVNRMGTPPTTDGLRQPTRPVRSRSRSVSQSDLRGQGSSLGKGTCAPTTKRSSSQLARRSQTRPVPFADSFCRTARSSDASPQNSRNRACRQSLPNPNVRHMSPGIRSRKDTSAPPQGSCAIESLAHWPESSPSQQRSSARGASPQQSPSFPPLITGPFGRAALCQQTQMSSGRGCQGRIDSVAHAAVAAFTASTSSSPRRRSVSPQQAEQFNVMAQSLQNAATAMRRALGPANDRAAGLDRVATSFRDKSPSAPHSIPHSPRDTLFVQSLSAPCLQRRDSQEGGVDASVYSESPAASARCTSVDEQERQCLLASIHQTLRTALSDATLKITGCEGSKEHVVDDGESNMMNSICEQLATRLLAERPVSEKQGRKPRWPDLRGRAATDSS